VRAPEQEPEGPQWTLEEYQKMFRNYTTEENYEVLDIEGRIPVDLEGSFYRNGPGKLHPGGRDGVKRMGYFCLVVKVKYASGRVGGMDGCVGWEDM